jgi:hypothetical protein
MHHSPNFDHNTHGFLQYLFARHDEMADTWDSPNVSSMPCVRPRELAKQDEEMLLYLTRSFAELYQHANIK